MSYLVITNRGTLNRRLLELIGLSTKRDQMKNNAVIGNKGSGSKLASVAALRLGISSGVTSTDERGSYFLEFDTEEISVDGIKARHVHYRYHTPTAGEEKSTVTRFPSSMVLEAFPDWDKAIGDDVSPSFKVLREHVCNAYDADKQFQWDVSEKRHFARKGKTSVYLSYTEEFVKIFEVPERYFKFLSAHQPYVTVGDIGQFWPKSESGKTRLFLLGVLVDCSADAQRTSLFDYSLNDKNMLSEERILKSADSYTYTVGRMLLRCEDAAIRFAVLQGVVQKMGRLEEKALGYAASATIEEATQKAWLTTVHAVLGEKICLPSQNESVNSDVLQIYGHLVLRDLSHDLKRFLMAIGVPSADDVFPKDPEERLELVRFQDLEESSRERFAAAFAVFAKHFPHRAHFPLYFYHPLDEAMARMDGFSGHDSTIFKEIWIRAKSRTELPTFTSLLITLNHEARHCETRLHDDHRGFVEAAEKDLLNEILRQLADATVEGEGIPDLGDAENLKPVFGDPHGKKAAVAGDSTRPPLGPSELKPLVLEEIDPLAPTERPADEPSARTGDDFALSVLEKINRDLENR